jgi:ATP-dependent helicase HrpB
MSRPTLTKLPIDEILPAVLASLEKHPSLVLQAAPGTGKTTRVPPALLKAPYLDPKKEILVLEPRRLAAKMSARRVAYELGEGVGQTVGYQFRFENMTGPRTRLRYLTEGMLMRRLIGDPELRTVAAVILDEFHERHLHSDVSLAYLKWLQGGKRPDLRLVAMSATLDTGSLSTYLTTSAGPAPVIQATAKQYNVAIEYLPGAPAKHLDQTVKDAVLSMLPKSQGDLLVFLPGMGEIRRAATALEPAAQSHRLIVAPLHGELSREEQDAALRPLETKPGLKNPSRKVILATNVAETSLTIEGVGVVIDSGLHRMASHSWWSGVPALRTRPTSRASAIQRAGRAGRLGPGHCLRLYTRGDFDGRPMFDAPEIQRADLTQTVLELGALGITDVESFPWFERPQAQALEASRGLLHRLGAITEPGPRGELTAVGRRMAQLPAHPRLSRVLIEAERSGVLEDAATLAAYIMESRLDGLDALQFLQRARMEESVWRVRSHLLSAFEHKVNPASSRGITAPAASSLKREDRLRFAILCGFPDRVARKRPGQDPNGTHFELLLSAGGSVRIENSSQISGAEAFVILDLQERQHMGQQRSMTQVQSLCDIQPEWLFDLEPTALQEAEEPLWDEARKRVLLSSRLVYDQIVLSESRADLSEGSPRLRDAAALMLKQAFGIDAAKLAATTAHDLTRALAAAIEPEVLESLLTRVSLAAKYFPETSLPDLLADPFAFGPALLKIVEGKSSLSELHEIDWESAVLSAYGELTPHQLGELAPSSVQLAAGRRVKVQYAFNQPPWIESRLQDFFGMKKGPLILRGRLPLTLHLLAPNQRAVQVTTDLEGFWQRAYPELRHQLSRRYPRHSWPENP